MMWFLASTLASSSTTLVSDRTSGRAALSRISNSVASLLRFWRSLRALLSACSRRSISTPSQRCYFVYDCRPELTKRGPFDIAHQNAGRHEERQHDHCKAMSSWPRIVDRLNARYQYQRCRSGDGGQLPGAVDASIQGVDQDRGANPAAEPQNDPQQKDRWAVRRERRARQRRWLNQGQALAHLLGLDVLGELRLTFTLTKVIELCDRRIVFAFKRHIAPLDFRAPQDARLNLGYLFLHRGDLGLDHADLGIHCVQLTLGLDVDRVVWCIGRRVIAAGRTLRRGDLALEPYDLGMRFAILLARRQKLRLQLVDRHG